MIRDTSCDPSHVSALRRALRERLDQMGMASYVPGEMAQTLRITEAALEMALDALYEAGELVYLTRINKDTGEVLKVIWFSE